MYMINDYMDTLCENTNSLDKNKIVNFFIHNVLAFRDKIMLQAFSAITAVLTVVF